MYAFMTTYSFDPEVMCSQAYPTWNAACEAMIEMVKKEYEISKNENGQNVGLEIDKTIGRAVLSDVFVDRTDKTVFFVFELPNQSDL